MLNQGTAILQVDTSWALFIIIATQKYASVNYANGSW